MKKTLAVVGAVALAGVLSITAAGCATSTRNLASLSSNWYYDTTFKRIQPTFDEESAERLTYKVTQAEKSHNPTYSVEYAEGTYTTEFYAKKITAAELEEITLEEWREDYTNALSKDGYMYLYYYKTERYVPSVTFTCNGESITSDERVQTESYFLSVEERLQPVFSVRLVNANLPRELQASSIHDCHTAIYTHYKSFYSLSGDSVKTYITDYLAETIETKLFEIDGLNGHSNSVFDVAYLDIVARGMRNVNGPFNQTIGIYTPGLQVGDYTVGTSDKVIFDGDGADDQLNAVQKVLEEKGLFTPTEEKTTLSTAAVGIVYNGGSFSGVSQTYWFAVGEDTNETRTLMVKYSEPLVYNLGTLDYVLTSIDNISL